MQLSNHTIVYDLPYLLHHRTSALRDIRLFLNDHTKYLYIHSRCTGCMHGRHYQSFSPHPTSWPWASYGHNRNAAADRPDYNQRTIHFP